MDLLQFLAFSFILLLSGTGVTGALKTSLDPSLEICILWDGRGVNELFLRRSINSLSVPLGFQGWSRPSLRGQGRKSEVL